MMKGVGIVVRWIKYLSNGFAGGIPRGTETSVIETDIEFKDMAWLRKISCSNTRFLYRFNAKGKGFIFLLLRWIGNEYKLED